MSGIDFISGPAASLFSPSGNVEKLLDRVKKGEEQHQINVERFQKFREFQNTPRLTTPTSGHVPGFAPHNPRYNLNGTQPKKIKTALEAEKDILKMREEVYKQPAQNAKEAKSAWLQDINTKSLFDRLTTWDKPNGSDFHRTFDPATEAFHNGISNALSNVKDSISAIASDSRVRSLISSVGGQVAVSAIRKSAELHRVPAAVLAILNGAPSSWQAGFTRIAGNAAGDFLAQTLGSVLNSGASAPQTDTSHHRRSDQVYEAIEQQNDGPAIRDYERGGAAKSYEYAPVGGNRKRPSVEEVD